MTQLVTVLDTEAPTLLGMFASRSGAAAAIQRSRARGVLDGEDMARVFSWLRPNDLVWLFVANNWVMGNRPPAFDILYWNSDTTRLPAEFHADLLRMFMENPLKAPGKITALGTPIDMSKFTVPAYVVAGIADHITPWQACYQSKNILRGKMDFVLSSSGHIQSIVNPPTNPKAKYFLNASLPETPEDWLAGATQHAGSWWDHWAGWYRGHGGGEVSARREELVAHLARRALDVVGRGLDDLLLPRRGVEVLEEAAHHPAATATAAPAVAAVATPAKNLEEADGAQDSNQNSEHGVSFLKRRQEWRHAKGR